MVEELEALRQENISLRDGWLKERVENEHRAERMADVRIHAEDRIERCRVEERKFADAWPESKGKGPPQALVEAWTERRTLQQVLELLDAAQRHGDADG